MFPVQSTEAPIMITPGRSAPAPRSGHSQAGAAAPAATANGPRRWEEDATAPLASLDVRRVMTAAEREVLRPVWQACGDRIIDCRNLDDPAFQAAHAAYASLRTDFSRAGSYCIRHDGAGGFTLIHRTRALLGMGPLVATPITRDADGWRLHVRDDARPHWSPLQQTTFATLDALKAALPSGMREVRSMSVADLEVTRL